MCPESASRCADRRSELSSGARGGKEKNQSLFVSLLCPESLSQSNTNIVIAWICGGVFLVILIGVVVYVVMRKLHNRHDYEG